MAEPNTLETWTTKEYFKCSFGTVVGWSLKTCPEVATVHIRDGADAPWCPDHGSKVFAAFLRGGRALGRATHDVLPPAMELLRTG